MSARAVVFAIAGTATGALLLIGVKGSQTSTVAGDSVSDSRLASLAGVSAASGPPVAGDYTVTGSVVQTPFGPVQVAAAFSGGKIKSVSALETPTEHGFSVSLNAFATPTLRQEALQAQDAKIDVVSGATYTSDAYAQSLQAALDKAAVGQHD
jgi:uncharacterized protein with FMN-binding domain